MGLVDLESAHTLLGMLGQNQPLAQLLISANAFR